MVRVEVSRRERVKVVPALPEFAGFVGVGEEFGILLGVTETLPSLVS